ncbi:hypothetical protein [Paraoerskovia sediminicola]
MWSEITVVVVLVVAVVGWLLWTAAVRLDRLHRKVVASRLALDAQLVRRASAASELAASGLLDPASSMLVAEAAQVELTDDLGDLALVADPGGPPEGTDEPGADAAELERLTVRDGLAQQFDPARARAESELSAILRGALGGPEEVRELCADPRADALVRSLGAAWYRVQLARRFHNQAVAQTQRVRRKWYVRYFRVAGHAALPVTVDFDDAAPSGIGR